MRRLINIIKQHIIKLVNRILSCIKSFIRKYYIFIIIIIVIIAMITFICTATIITPGNFESQQILINGISLENWSTIITTTGLLSTAIWSMYQYNKSRIAKQQEKASEIAQTFSSNLIEKTGLICDVLKDNDEVKKMVHSITKSKELNQFTTLEILNILNDRKCFEKYDKIIKSQRTQAKYTELLSKRYDQFERQKFNSYFPLLVENTLNQLEAICINISSEAAGSQFIYNSLHQSLLYTVEVLAVKISSHNNNNVDKYYTNIIDVYNMWNIQKDKDIKKLERTQSKINKLNDKVKKEVNKLLNKKGKTV